ncbi:MAG: extracellular solute-binding protein [Candidatus Competibacter sp.]
MSDCGQRSGRRWGLAILLLAVGGGLPLWAAELTVHGPLDEALLAPVLRLFTQETGHAVRYVRDEPEALLRRLGTEGMATTADVLLGVDSTDLRAARQAGLLRAVRSKPLAMQISPQYRDSDDFWYGLTVRARVLLYARARVSPAELTGYESLAESRWRKRLCMDVSVHAGGHALLTALLAHWGFERSLEWAQGVAANLANEPQGNDRNQMRALVLGVCDVAVVNTQDYVRILRSEREEDRIAVRQIGMVWPDQGAWGAIIDVAGAGVTAHTRQADVARQFLEFLVGDAAQRLLAAQTDAYPVVPGIPVASALLNLGAFKADQVNLAAPDGSEETVARILAASGWK